MISIHALLAESDTYHFMPNSGTFHFYPRSPCGERLKLLPERFGYTLISIHALLAESDSAPRFAPAASRRFLSTLSLRRATRRHRGNDRRPVHFYPRSPCGERPMQIVVVIVYALFLSTLSLRRATMLTACHNGQLLDFYPRSPCGERPLNTSLLDIA